MPDVSITIEPTPSTPLLASGPAPAALTNRRRRTPLVDRIVPPLILFFMATAYYQVTRRVLRAYVRDHLHRPILSIALFSFLTLVISFLLSFYLSVYLLPRTHSSPPRVPPEGIFNKTVVFECVDDEGNYERCFKGDCDGAWKGARVRHCSVCDLCRAGFDHHCPWFATCITFKTLPSFLLFLLLTPLTVIPPTLPILVPLYRHVLRIYRFSWEPASWIATNWYNRWWSWVAGIGPFGRIGVGVVMGFWSWDDDGKGKDWEKGKLVLVVLAGWAVSIIALGLAVSTLSSILSSQTPIEGRILSAHHRIDPRTRRTPPPTSSFFSPTLVSHPYADPRVRVFVPSSAKDGKGTAVFTRPEERLYDLGWKDNLRMFWRAGAEGSLPRMNPVILKRLEYEAGLKRLELDEDHAASSEVEDLEADEEEDF